MYTHQYGRTRVGPELETTLLMVQEFPEPFDLQLLQLDLYFIDFR